MIRFVQRAEKEGYSTIIFNPNLNKYLGASIDGSESMEKHCQTVWNQYITLKSSTSTPAKKLYIIAHSAGGYCTYGLFNNNWDEFNRRVHGLALTDSFFGNADSQSKKCFMRTV